MKQVFVWDEPTAADDMELYIPKSLFFPIDGAELQYKATYLLQPYEVYKITGLKKLATYVARCKFKSETEWTITDTFLTPGGAREEVVDLLRAKYYERYEGGIDG